MGEIKKSWDWTRDGIRRGRNAARVIRLAVMLSQRSYTISELAAKTLGCTHSGDYEAGSCHCRKAIRRDIQALEYAGIPVVQNGEYGARYSVDAHFMKRFT